jgi:hypothetical protein
MARSVGRPPRPQSIDPELLDATRRALLQLGKDLGLPSGRYVDPNTGRSRSRPEPLALAVLALQAQEALEVLAAREVALARDQDEMTWEQVGDGFGISAQSAHHRFAKKV